MKFTNLGSGSGGNASVVAFDGEALLIDCGLPKRRVLAGLHGLRLRGVLITHRHSDHLKAHASNLGAPLFVEEANWRDARRLKMVEGRAEHFYEMPFRVGSFRVTPFALPHPGEESWNSWGFRVEAGGSSIAYATDLGHVTDAVVEAARAWLAAHDAQALAWDDPAVQLRAAIRDYEASLPGQEGSR